MKTVFAVLVVVAACGVGCRMPIVWTPPPPTQPSTVKDFNVWWSDTGPNGAPKNPQWSAQQQAGHPLPPVSCGSKQPYDAACTDVKVVKDKAEAPNIAICSAFNKFPPLPGHADWMVAEYTGAIGWLNYAADFDFNFELFPELNAGITRNNHLALGVQKEGDEPEKTPMIEVEFDPRETVANFSTSWWKRLMEQAEEFAANGNPPRMNQHDANVLPLGVVFGLFGLDCEHGCRSEVHPVYGFAIQADDRSSDNTWAIFVRNWGDGGFCSRLNHELSTGQNRITVLLPRMGAAGPSPIEPSDFEFASTGKLPAPTFEFRPGQGLAVTFTLQEPANHVQAELVLHLHWPDGSTPFPYPSVHYVNAQRVQLTESLEAPDDAESYLGKLLRDAHAPEPKVAPLALPLTLLHHTQMMSADEKVEITVPTNDHPAPTPPPKAKGRLSVKKAGEEGELGLVRQVCAAYPAGKLPTDKIKDLNKICQSLATTR